MPGYGLFLAMLIQICIPCVLGFFVEFTVCIQWVYPLIILFDHHSMVNKLCVLYRQHDQIYDGMLEVDWYKFRLDDQRAFLLYMQSCQNPTLLTIGGLYPLNLVTGAKVMTFISFIGF